MSAAATDEEDTSVTIAKATPLWAQNGLGAALDVD
jgi:hypothetical protein